MKHRGGRLVIVGAQTIRERGRISDGAKPDQLVA
jgi:hypothetical protein